MDKKITKIFAVCVLLSLVGITNLQTVKADNTYITWNKEITYEIQGVVDELPITFEAKLQLPKTVTSTAGVLVGNRNKANNDDCVNLEISTNGNPLLWIRSNNTRYQAKFTDVDVRTESEFVHLVITRDIDNDLVNCYLNGELKQSITLDLDSCEQEALFMMAGDRTASNPNYFKGTIESFALYSDIRTESEIQLGMNDFSCTDSNLILGYNLANLIDDYRILDESENNHYIQKIVTWVDPEDLVDPGEYDYSFAVVGDTQYANERYSEDFPKIYDYIIDNVKTKKIKHVFGLGDITDTSSKAAWALADENIARMDGVVPYSLVRGNHDKERWFDYVFGPDNKYQNKYYNQYFENYLNIRNTAHTFSAGDLDYLVIVLDFGAPDDVLNWAGSVIERHPHHNVIITTHGYLAADGTTLDATDSGRPSEYGSVYNDGDGMWTKLASKYENVVMVLSGHIGSDDIVRTEAIGEHGNVVNQFLINPQYVDDRLGGVGLVSMFYISEGGSKVVVDYYSTFEEKFFKLENQFSFNLHTVPRKPSTEEDNNNENEDVNNNQNSSENTAQNSSSISQNSSIITSTSVDNTPTTDSKDLTKTIIIVSVVSVSVLGILALIIFIKKRMI